MDQVSRLQSLLETVQANRALPRKGAVAPAVVARSMPEPEPEEFDVEIDAEPVSMAQEPPFAEESMVSAMPTPLPTSMSPRSSAGPSAPAPGSRRGEPSPLQRAFDQEIRQVDPAGSPTPEPAPASMAPVSMPAQRSANDGPEEIPLAMPSNPSRPIVHVVSPVPALRDATFGELLRRSLALRPL